MKNGSKLAYPLEAGATRHFGLTKRELFAAMAMQGILANHDPEVSSLSEEAVALSADNHARALLERLERTP